MPCILAGGALRYGRGAPYANGRTLDPPVVRFSPRRTALTLYLAVDFKKKTDLLGTLGRYTDSKACLYITRLSDVDMKVLMALVMASVKDTRGRNGSIRRVLPVIAQPQGTLPFTTRIPIWHMTNHHLPPDQLRALREKHHYPDQVIMGAFELVSANHTNPVSAVDIALSHAREQGRDPLAVARELSGKGPRTR